MKKSRLRGFFFMTFMVSFPEKWPRPEPGPDGRDSENEQQLTGEPVVDAVQDLIGYSA